MEKTAGFRYLKGMKIRSYTPSDRAACLALFNSNVPVFFHPSELMLFESFLDAIERGESGKPTNREEHYYVLEDKDALVGCGGVCLRETGNEACMAWGMVDNALHRQGYGRELLIYRLEKMGELFPNSKVVLDTTQHSYSFFERFGFNTKKITDDFYGPGLHRYDMVKEG